jgi:predicted DNA-binding transcriptional regulator AlpA
MRPGAALDAPAPALLRADDAARYLGISRASFFRHIAPRVPRVRVGAAVRYWTADLDQLIAAARERGEEPGGGR